MTDQPIVFLAGLGVDERLFVRQRPPFPTLVVPRWIEPHPGEALREYSRRMAATISPHPDMILGGVSMGGMVALEMAKILKPRGLVLIGSCQRPNEIFGWIRAVASVARYAPALRGNHMKWIAKMGMPLMGVCERGHREILLQLAEDLSSKFACWAAGAIVDWPGATPAMCPVLRIHGRRDRMIRCPLESSSANQTTAIVAGAGHVLNLTHAEEVNDAIASWVANLNHN